MTDKERIYEKIEKRYEYLKEREFDSHSVESEIRMSECQHLLLMINSLQEEPSKFDTAIQEGDDVRYNEDLGCRVNLSQLKRVAKKEEPTSEDLEKASYRFACRCHPLKTEYSTEIPNPEVIEAFKVGAKWQKEQMMTKAIDAHVNYAWSGLSFGGFNWSKTGLDLGDECKLIIIKED